MDYTAEQWARMREEAVRTAFAMQKRAQPTQAPAPPRARHDAPLQPPRQQNPLPPFFRAEHGVERYAAAPTPKPPPAPARGQRPSPPPPPKRPAPKAQAAPPKRHKSNTVPKNADKVHLASGLFSEDAAFLLPLIMLLRAEGADNTLLAMLLYILL